MTDDRSTQDAPAGAGGHGPDPDASSAHIAVVARRDAPTGDSPELPVEGGYGTAGQALAAPTIGGPGGRSADPGFSAGDAGPGSTQRGPCGGRTKGGGKCGIVMVQMTPEGWRCRYHRDAPPAGARLRPPVRSLRSMEDVARLTSWAAVRVAEGSLSQSAALAIKSMCSEWRQAFADGEAVRRLRLFFAVVEAAQGDERIMAVVMENAAVRARWGEAVGGRGA